MSVDLERAHECATRIADDICDLSGKPRRCTWWWRIYYREFFGRTR